ncbi:hypothetical protein GO998_13190 [Ralstonia syzygii]|uniref:Uncharacterized protein n=1 Tax=Ralstonia syzygii TaxID=28097 RepID=A0ABX7ZIB2_9RALS|nr:hypothetical protein [Ralstonia syzygii]QUP54619.1 hypothetical protein GO998_13190 [Ralstonia syzygii]
MPTTFTVQVQAAIPDWQSSEVNLAPSETADISASGTWGVIDPRNPGNCGPGGEGIPAGKEFMLGGAPEGCLLVRDGSGNVVPYPSNGSGLKIHEPGTISFIANDDPNPPLGQGFNGFNDNSGALTVTITVSAT